MNSNSTAEAVLRQVVCYPYTNFAFYCASSWTREFKFYCGSGIETLRNLLMPVISLYMNSKSTAEAVLRAFLGVA